METTLKNTSLGLFLLISVILSGQPSSSIRIDFKLLWEGAPVGYEEFCAEYRVQYVGYPYDLSPCNPEHGYHPRFSKGDSGDYSVFGTVVYNDLFIEIIRGNDSMKIMVPTYSGTRGEVNLGVLNFQAGYYQVYANLVDTFDLALGRAEAYNQLAAQFRHDRDEGINFYERYYYNRLLRLHRLYGFPGTEFLERPREDFE